MERWDYQLNEKELYDSICEYIEDLKHFSEPGEGVTRLPFTEPAMKAADYLLQKMTEMGLETSLEPNGAVKGMLRGKKEERILIAPHYDPVVNGGAYDGCLGVACGMALAKQLKLAGCIPEYTIEILATNDEEGVRFNTGYFTIKSMLGEVDEEYLHKYKDADGVSIYEAMQYCGMDPKRIGNCIRPRNSICHFVEIHIEQGPVLEREQVSIGIVDAIVGIRRYEVTVWGQADHAGTTPMAVRKDAVMAAAQMLCCLRQKCLSFDNTVLTAGAVKVFPNAVNIVPERAVFTLDIRSTQNSALEELEQEITEAGKLTGLEVSCRSTLCQKPVTLDVSSREHLERIANQLGYSFMHINSGAGHDSLEAAKAWPATMLFIPSRGGRSHCPQEASDMTDAVKAVNMIARLIFHKQ